MRKFSIEAARVTAGLTQEQLAKEMGVSRVSVGNWERGVKRISRSHFLAFLKVTGFEEDEIFLPNKSPKRVRMEGNDE